MPDTEVTQPASGSFAGLSRRSRLVVFVAAFLVGGMVTIHLGMIFLHVAPPNVLSREYSSAINGYVRPEFRQNWKLFAPEPLHVNREIYARAEVRTPDGGVETTDWIDLTAVDIEHTKGNLVPSHTRNQFRKGWRTYLGTHDDQDRPLNVTGQVVAEYLKRATLLRMSTVLDPHSIVRIQLRVATIRVADPEWSTRKSSTEPTYREVRWWPVSDRDFPRGSGR